MRRERDGFHWRTCKRESEKIFGFERLLSKRPKYLRVVSPGNDGTRRGDPKDAASPALDSKLLLSEVQAVVHGHATKTFEKHRKRAGPPSLCFSLLSSGRTLDLQVRANSLIVPRSLVHKGSTRFDSAPRLSATRMLC